jgi:adenylylsulfate kinase
MSKDVRQTNIQEGFTVWITGLPFSGKKETGKMLAERLNMLGYKTSILIGGEIRKHFEDQLGFTKQETQKNIRRIAFECKLLSDGGVIAIAATISPYRDLRREARRQIKRYIEVYLKCPMEVLKERDDKDLYQKALDGTLKDVAGITIPYEESEETEVVIETDKVKPFEAASTILNKLKELGFLEEAEHSVLLKQEEKDILQILRDTWFK